MTTKKHAYTVEGYQPIETIKSGEFVQKKAGAKKVFEVVGYCRMNKRYMATDCDNFCSEVGFKKGTLVYVGFDY